MKKNQSSFVGQELDFYHWLSTQPDNKLALDFYIILPTINAYGKKRRCFEESLFELRDSEHVKKFRNMVQDDKRFRFLNYGRIRQILLILEKYDQYLQEKEKAIVTKTPVSEQHTPVKTHTEDDQFFDDVSPAEPVLDELKPEDDYVFEEPTFVQSESDVSVVDDMNPVKPASEESKKDAPVSETVTGNNGSIVIRTINGTEYRGNTPAEALASFCEAMARKYPDKVKELIGMRVLTTERTCQDRITLQNVQGFIDRNLKESAVMRYAKWLSDSCGESDSPKTIMVSALKPDEVQPAIKSESSVSSDASKPQESSMGTAQPEAAVSATRTWTKYEVALLIEAYLKTAENKGNFRTIAEDLSHTLRELAAKHGKAIDSTYRNVNGIVMQLGTVQYIFTNGQSGFSNSSAQIRDMVSVYKNWPAEYHQTLAEAHRLVNEPSSEIYKLLPEEDFSLFRNELFRRKIQSVEQLKSLDLWAFINRYGLYSISKRQEICNRVRDRLNPPVQKPVGNCYCLKTSRGNCFYGNTPAEALALYCESLAVKYPLKIRNLIGLRYNGVGMVVLHPSAPQGGGVRLSNPAAYMDNSISEKTAQLYALWICQKCGDNEEPVSVSALSEEKRAAALEKQPEIKSTPAEQEQTPSPAPLVPAEPPARAVVFEPITKADFPKEPEERKEEKSRPSVKQNDKSGEGWLFKMISVMNIRYDDKRDRNGCLWIWGGHELDQFISLCAKRGYQFHYKPDASKGPAWWTTDCVTDEVQLEPEKKDLSPHKTELPVEKRVRLADFELWLIRQKSISSSKAKLYESSMKSLEGHVERNKLGESLLLGSAGRAESFRETISDRADFREADQRMNGCYSKALDLWIEFLGGTARKEASLSLENAADQTKLSTVVFRRWLDENFRSYLMQKQHLARGTAVQYCQSIEAIEQFFVRNGLAMTLKKVNVEQVVAVHRKLSSNPDFVAWNKHGHHQYSAALARYIDFVKANQSTENEERDPAKLTVKDAVIKVLSSAVKPMSVADITDEIVRRRLYLFKTENPLVIVNHAIRRACEGIRLPDHDKENVFGLHIDSSRVAKYYLLDKAGQADSERETTKREIKWPENKPESRTIEYENPQVSGYALKQAEKIVLESDLEGITVELLAAKMKTTVAAAKRTVNASPLLVEICNRLIHKESFVDWDQAADTLEAILDKLMEKNNGYVSRALLYEYARIDLQMFMNDNNMNDPQKIYDMAVDLFSKEIYHGVSYSFSNLQHISKPEKELSSTLGVMRNFAWDRGGYFTEEELISYLESVKIKTGNLRGQMQVYDKPIFLFYADHEYVLAESMKIDETWLARTKKALDNLFADMGDHVVLRDIQPIWYYQLPTLPGDRPWTALLLQSILRFFSRSLGGVHTIYALPNQSGDVLHAMLVTANSEVQNFADAIIAILVDGRIEKRQFEAEELRKILVSRGLIEGNELIWNMPKATVKDARFVWSSDGQSVAIKV